MGSSNSTSRNNKSIIPANGIDPNIIIGVDPNVTFGVDPNITFGVDPIIIGADSKTRRKDYKNIIKCIIIGPMKSGKTTLTHTICSIRPFFEKTVLGDSIKSYEPTIGVEFQSKLLYRSNYDGSSEFDIQPDKYQIWDISGNKSYQHIIDIYYQRCALAIAVYCDDMESIKSYVDRIQTTNILLIVLQNIRNHSNPIYQVVQSIDSNLHITYYERNVTISTEMGILFNRFKKVIHITLDCSNYDHMDCLFDAIISHKME